MKYLVGIAFVFILGALAAAGVFMLRSSKDNDDRKARRMARALALRVGLSVTLFLVILLSWHLGWIQPTGMPVAR